MKRLLISLSLAMMLVLVMVMPAMAANTDDTEITGTVSGFIDVTSPAGPIDIGPLTLGSTITQVDLFDVNVKCNEANWTLEAEDLRISPISKGYMDNGTNALTGGPFTIMGGDVASYTSVASAVVLETGTDSTTTGAAGIDISISCEQDVAAYEVAGDYTITITFTGALAP